MPDVDVAILGGGCAGLSVAARLAGSGVSFRVVEPRARYTDDRAWSFWRTAPDPFEPCVRASWSGWTVEGPGGTVGRGSGRTPYQTVSAGAFYGHAQDLIHDAPGGSITLGTAAEGVVPASGAFRVDTSDGSFTARHVLDGRPPARRPRYGQFFLGREIATAEPVFDPRTVPLMHFRRGYSAGVDFLYILPFARDRALVEVTSFAPARPSAETFAAWLADEIAALGVVSHDVLREEAGALPMEVDYAETPVAGTTRIGLGGGAARPSTGYAFQRIQAQADALATALVAGEAPRLPAERPMTRFMDRVFLQVLATAPERGPALFESLFRNAPPERLERFLSGSTRAADRLSVMAALPPLPFLRAAARPE
ncbi:lycopene cyclase [Rhodovulum sp. 12E13]|uniref:lycopene cyclase family protein n=1 Tax=Rhodovulum sp. 12E13 TaxID=2203891 RepID=UPI000E12E6B8|nr:lycopene cyclase family protein [Rhodovulum sp. 12E13]RDC71025.1 lycopene cyclase [Rhodovulum sp. 12E13]